MPWGYSAQAIGADDLSERVSTFHRIGARPSPVISVSGPEGFLGGGIEQYPRAPTPRDPSSSVGETWVLKVNTPLAYERQGITLREGTYPVEILDAQVTSWFTLEDPQRIRGRDMPSWTPAIIVYMVKFPSGHRVSMHQDPDDNHFEWLGPYTDLT